jgi:BASS family bile acid:Na+ symporter
MLLEFIDKAGLVAILVLVVTSMTAIGMGYSITRIIAPLRDARLVLVTLSANFVLMPLASLGLSAALRLDEPLAEGLLLLGMASGAPLIPNLVGLAKGSLPLAVGIMILLTAGTLVYLPLILPLFLPGVIVGSLSVARPLLLFMLLPLAIGIVLKAYHEDLAVLVRPLLDAISNVSLVPIIALILLLNINNVLQIFGSHGIMAAVLLTIFGVGVGWLVGGANVNTRRVLALSTGTRNFTVALVLATQSFDDPRVEIMVIVAAVIGILSVLPVCWVWGMRPVASG